MGVVIVEDLPSGDVHRIALALINSIQSPNVRRWIQFSLMCTVSLARRSRSRRPW